MEHRYVTEEQLLLAQERCANALKTRVSETALKFEDLSRDVQELIRRVDCIQKRLSGENGTPGINEEVRSLRKTIEEHGKFIDKLDKMFWKILGGIVASTVAGGGLAFGAVRVLEFIFAK